MRCVDARSKMPFVPRGKLRMAAVIFFIYFFSNEARSSSAVDFGYFSGSINTEWISDGKLMRLLKSISFTDPNGMIWEAPKNSIIDGASIPQFAWSFIGSPFVGKYRYASVIHDVACEQKRRTWEVTHLAFYYAMLASDVSWLQANIMYAAVYHFGPRWPISSKLQIREIGQALADFPICDMSKKDKQVCIDISKTKLKELLHVNPKLSRIVDLREISEHINSKIDNLRANIKIISTRMDNKQRSSHISPSTIPLAESNSITLSQNSPEKNISIIDGLLHVYETEPQNVIINKKRTSTASSIDSDSASSIDSDSGSGFANASTSHNDHLLKYINKSWLSLQANIDQLEDRVSSANLNSDYGQIIELNKDLDRINGLISDEFEKLKSESNEVSKITMPIGWSEIELITPPPKSKFSEDQFYRLVAKLVFSEQNGGSFDPEMIQSFR